MNLNIQIRTADAKSFQREFYPAHVSRRRRTATEYIKTPLLGFVRYLLSLLRHQGPSILCLDVRQKQMQGTCKLGALKAVPGSSQPSYGVLRLQVSADGRTWHLVGLSPFPKAASYRVGPVCSAPERFSGRAGFEQGVA